MPVYFDKRRGLATSLNATAIGISQMFFPQIIRILQDNLGYSGSILMYSGITLNCCVAAGLFQPVEWHTKTDYTESKDENKVTRRNDMDSRKNFVIKELASPPSPQSLPNITRGETKKDSKSITCFIILKEIASDIAEFLKCCIQSMKSFKVIILCFGLGLFLMGYLNIVMMIPFIVMEAGYSYEYASNCITCIAVSSTTTRLIMAMLLDRSWFNVKSAYLSGSVIAAVSCLCMYIIEYFMICT